jgi:hypothetical protein
VAAQDSQRSTARPTIHLTSAASAHLVAGREERWDPNLPTSGLVARDWYGLMKQAQTDPARPRPTILADSARPRSSAPDPIVVLDRVSDWLRVHPDVVDIFNIYWQEMIRSHREFLHTPGAAPVLLRPRA